MKRRCDSSFAVIAYQALHGCTSRCAYLEARLCGCLMQFVAIVVCDGAYEIHLEVGALVVGHIAQEELAEAVDKQLMYGRQVAMTAAEAAELAKETVGKWSSIHVFHDGCRGVVGLVEEELAHLPWHLAVLRCDGRCEGSSQSRGWGTLARGWHP